MSLVTELNFRKQLFGEQDWEVIRSCSVPPSDDPKVSSTSFLGPWFLSTDSER